MDQAHQHEPLHRGRAPTQQSGTVLAGPGSGCSAGRLVDAARAEGSWLELLIGVTALNCLAEIAQSADRVLRRDPAYLRSCRTGPTPA